MNRKILIGGAVLAVLALITVAYVLRPPEEASAPIEAVPLELETEVSAPEPTGAPATAPAADASGTGEAATSATTAASTSGTDAAESQTGGLVLYTISQDESEARFSIDEILNDSPFTAIGVTNQVAGEIAVGFDDPSATQLGEITINARTFQTDSSNRDRMINNEILDTAEFEFITFTPTGITGLPAAITPGQEISFQVTGDLAIRSVTQPVTFDVTATVGSDGRLEGFASTTILRSDYDITIPSVPRVAEVSDEVLVEFDFVAYSE